MESREPINTIFLTNLCVAVLSGLIYGYAWRWDAGPIGLIGLAFFLVAQANCHAWKSAVFIGLISGTISYLVACPWLSHTISYLSIADPQVAFYLTPLAAFVQGAHFGLFSLIWLLARKLFHWGWVLAPLIWIAVEDIWPGFFPCRVGNLLNEFPPLCQIGSVGGATLVSFQAALIAGGMAILFMYFSRGLFRNQWKLEWRCVGFGMIVLVGSLIFGHERLRSVNEVLNRPSKEPDLRVLIVQSDTDDVDCVDRMREVSDQFRDKVDLLIWPEGSLASFHADHLDFKASKRYTDGRGVEETYESPYSKPAAALLAAGDSWLPNPDTADGKTNFVTAFLINKEEKVIGRHEKVHLMPYGETVPGEWLLPSLRKWYGSDRIIATGKKTDPIGEINGFKLGVMLCCEDMHPSFSRQLARQDADVLVTLGSGAAFDSSIALRQHFRISKLRSIETGKYFVRCTSKGVSGLVAPTGKTIGEMEMMKELATPVSIPNRKISATFFARFGWVGCYVPIILITLVMVFLGNKPDSILIHPIPAAVNQCIEGKPIQKKRKKVLQQI